MSIESYVKDYILSSLWQANHGEIVHSINGHCGGQLGALFLLPNAANFVVETEPRVDCTTVIKGAERYEVVARSLPIGDEFLNMRFTRIRKFNLRKHRGEWDSGGFNDVKDMDERELEARKFNEQILPSGTRGKTEIWYPSVHRMNQYFKMNKIHKYHANFRDDVEKFTNDEVVEETKKQLKGKILFTIFLNNSREDGWLQGYGNEAKETFELLGLKTLFEIEYDNRVHEGKNYLTTCVLQG